MTTRVVPPEPGALSGVIQPLVRLWRTQGRRAGLSHIRARSFRLRGRGRRCRRVSPLKNGMSPQQRLFWSVVVLVGVFALGTTGYVYIEDTTYLDAAYMMAITLSTVGYNTPFELDTVGKIWTMAVITVGLISVSVAFTSLVALFVSGELRAHLGSRKVETQISRMKKHVIICGYGRMGRLVAKELRSRGERVVVVEVRPERREEMREAGLLSVVGDATEEDTLVRAGLMRARALVSVLPHDADNVYVTLTAHGLRGDLKIVARAEEAATEPKLKHAGAQRVICPQIIGASRIANILTRPHVTDFFEVAAKGVELEMDEYEIAEGSALDGVSLRDSLLRQKADVMIVAIKRADGETVYNPPPEVVLSVSDRLIIIGPSGVSKRLDALGFRDDEDREDGDAAGGG